MAQPSVIARVMSATLRTPAVLFPYLPTPGRLGATALVVATLAATGMAWFGNITSSAGPIVGVFLALMLTGFVIASAALPRVVYTWLEREDWFARHRDPWFFGPNFWSVIGAHFPLVMFMLTNSSIAQGHPAYDGLAAAATAGAGLWVLHEALRARKRHIDVDVSGEG